VDNLYVFYVQDFPKNLRVKEFCKSVNMCRSYDQKSSVLFFTYTAYNLQMFPPTSYSSLAASNLCPAFSQARGWLIDGRCRPVNGVSSHGTWHPGGPLPRRVEPLPSND